MDVNKSLEQVNDRESFGTFLKCLSKDFDENHDEWENWTIAEYLESISAWIKDSGEELEECYLVSNLLVNEEIINYRKLYI